MNANAATGPGALLPLACLLGFLAGCSKPDVAVSIPFAAYFGQEAIACGQDAGPVQLTDLRLYVSELHLLPDEGEPTPVLLEADNQWQQGDLALLDFEDSTGRCENGTTVTHSVLRGSMPPGSYRGLAFTVGVPFDRNHADPLQADPPLGDSAMHWSWRGGYKFLRAGIRSETDGHWIHLGSTGCEGRINAITGCSSPNRVTVVLPEFQLEQHAVGIDLAALFATVDLDDADATDCSSGPAETHCAGDFDALGLDFATGARKDSQRVFHTRTVN